MGYSKGHIRIGGIDIKEISTENLMDLVSFVFQDTFLFHDTLYENIRVGRPDATKEEIFKAAKAAQCHEFITGLEKVMTLSLVKEALIFQVVKNKEYV
ncbi:hypothetical protein JQ035_04835 [Clostridium botulinum]|nr:hypothetical protein [Clostridium botulinum]